MTETPAIRARDLRLGYGQHVVLSDASLDVRAGELVAVVGPNGTGKSTLLRTLLGFLEPQRGTVELEGTAVRQLPRREIARRAAFVPQGFHTEFAFTVREMVAMGRTPHLGRFRPEGAQDRTAIAQALRDTGMEDMAERRFTELSGGEQQRVLLARAFAQGTSVLVLDEPTASLDLLHAYQLMDLVRRRAREGAAVVAALHDIGLAARFCDRMVVLSAGHVQADGAPAEVLTESMMAEVFGVDATVLTQGEELFVAVRGPSRREE